MIIHTDRVGRTAGGRYTYRPLVEYEADDYPPDSRYWQNAADGAARALAHLVGDEPHKTWAEMVWPGATIDDLSWRSICEMNEAALAQAEKGERNLETLARAALAQQHGECNCVLPEQSCPVCRVSEYNEIPY